MRKIIINGFPHCGTTILRRIIGDHPDVLDIEKECYDYDVAPVYEMTHPSTTHLVCKFVGLPIQLYSYDVARIWLIKNPWDVFGSFVRRFGQDWKKIHHHQLKDYLQYCERWTTEMLDGHEMTLRYEDLMAGGGTYEILGKIGLPMIQEVNRKAGVGSRAPIPHTEPGRHMSLDFRTWQINQPIKDMTYESAPWCPLEILKTLGDYPIIQDAGYPMTQVEGLWFPVGAKLTSIENGQLIIAKPGTAKELIVGEVTKEGIKL